MHEIRPVRRFATVAGALAAVFVLTASPAAAVTPPSAGWMVSRIPGGYAQYTPLVRDRWNSVGTNETDHVARYAVGGYSVTFHGYEIGDGIAMVTAMGTNHVCITLTWGPDTADTYVTVRCYDRTSGKPADSALSVNYVYRPVTGNPPMGYFYLDTANQSYDLTPGYVYNSSGGIIHVQHTSNGHWTDTFAGLGGVGGNVQVSAYGVLAACAPTGWRQVGADETIDVVCRSASGHPVDAQYDLTFTRGLALRGSNTGAGAYFVADKPLVANDQPAAQFRFSTSGQIPIIHRSSKGTYRVVLTGISGGGGSAQVTSMSAGAVACNLDSISTAQTTQRAVVRCTDDTGAPVDSKFSFVFTR